MGPMSVRVRNAERMMTRARAVRKGIEFEFADGFRGVVPFSELPGTAAAPSLLAEIQLPSPYLAVLRTRLGETIELPWDFVRHFCDASYKPRMEAVAAAGREALGNRIRQAREEAGLTQEALAARAGIGRATLVRIEKGEQSPRYRTLVSLAEALGYPLHKLLVDEETPR